MIGGRSSLALAALLGLAACTPEIGDACTNSTHCSNLGDRVCDRSFGVGQEGECTIEGCSRGTCPEEAMCVVVYNTRFLSVACDPFREDVAVPADPDECTADECPPLPPLDDCEPSEICLPEGMCASQLSARTSCRRACKNGDDCRPGYQCARTGEAGIYRAPDPDKPALTGQGRICVPDPFGG